MKSLMQLGSGGAVIPLWKVLYGWAKLLVIVGATVFCTIELTVDGNHAFYSNWIFHGQAADAEAKIDDPVQALQDAVNGKPVSGAMRTVAATYLGLDGDGRQKQAVARAVEESIDDIIEKRDAGTKISTTEALKLTEYEIKQQELKKATAEAEIKLQEARASGAKADQDIAISQMITGNSTQTPGDIARRSMDMMAPSIFGGPFTAAGAVNSAIRR
jgi:hypothetical protein